MTLLHAHGYATNADEIGVRGPAQEDALLSEEFGFHNFLVNEGYSALVERLTARLGDRLLLSAPVREIRSVHDGAVVQVVGDDGVLRQEHSARAVVVTVPLSLLKAETIRFDPPLPAGKRAAIRRIGFGHAYALHLTLRTSGFRAPARRLRRGLRRNGLVVLPTRARGSAAETSGSSRSR